LRRVSDTHVKKGAREWMEGKIKPRWLSVTLVVSHFSYYKPDGVVNGWRAMSSFNLLDVKMVQVDVQLQWLRELSRSLQRIRSALRTIRVAVVIGILAALYAKSSVMVYNIPYALDSRCN
jgi:hypothetical protein